MNNIEQAKRFIELSAQLKNHQLDRNNFVEFLDLSNKAEDYARSYLDAIQEVERLRGVISTCANDLENLHREMFNYDDIPSHISREVKHIEKKALEGANGND